MEFFKYNLYVSIKIILPAGSILLAGSVYMYTYTFVSIYGIIYKYVFYTM